MHNLLSELDIYQALRRLYAGLLGKGYFDSIVLLQLFILNFIYIYLKKNFLLFIYFIILNFFIIYFNFIFLMFIILMNYLINYYIVLLLLYVFIIFYYY